MSTDEFAYSDGIVPFFVGTVDTPNPVKLSERQAEEELQRLNSELPGVVVNVLKYWKGQAESNYYKIISQVAKGVLHTAHLIGPDRKRLWGIADVY